MLLCVIASDISTYIVSLHQSPHLSEIGRVDVFVGQIAKQQLVSLESTDDILGISSTDDRLFVLTNKTLFVIRVTLDIVNKHWKMLLLLKSKILDTTKQNRGTVSKILFIYTLHGKSITYTKCASIVITQSMAWSPKTMD